MTFYSLGDTTANRINSEMAFLTFASINDIHKIGLILFAKACNATDAVGIDGW